MADLPTIAPRMAHAKRRTCLAGALLFLGLIVAWFGAMTGYYAWQIKHGRYAELERTFQSAQFTRDTSRAKMPAPAVADIRPSIRKENPVRGDASAPITILAFIDFECPFSQRGYPVFERVAERYAPVIRVVFKHFPIDAIHPNAVAAANAAACAGGQGKFWEYYHRLLTEKTLEEANLLAHARVLVLSEEPFRLCMENRPHQRAIDKDLEDGVDLGVQGTPTYFVNGVKIEGVAGEAVWDRIILQELQKLKNGRTKK